MRRIAWLLSALLVCVCTDADAQDKSKGKAGSAKQQASPPKAAPVKQKRKLKKAEEPKGAGQRNALATGAAPPPPPMAADDEGDVRKEGATDIKTLEFTGLDIEGQLKTPQMLYFLNRLRAEFDRPELPHRSFMPELSRSSKEKDL